MTLVLQDFGWMWTFVVKIIKVRHRLYQLWILHQSHVRPLMVIQKWKSNWKRIFFQLRSDRVCPNTKSASVASDSMFAVNKVIILQHDNLKMLVQYSCHIIVLDIRPRFYTEITKSIGRQIHSILMNVFKIPSVRQIFQLAISSKESSLVT